MKAFQQVDPMIARYNGYYDMNGEFVPFTMADEVFSRARRLGARVLLRLELSESRELQGLFYTNDKSLTR